MAQSGFDRRRINGPEESFGPVYDDAEEDTVVYASWKVGDPRRGRKPSDIRSIFLQVGLISQANGSAYIETERTKVACAVYGPRQSKSTAYSEKGRLNVEVKFAPFSCGSRRAPLRDAEDRSVAVHIQQSLAPAVRLELLPKSVVDVFLTVIECDGIDACVAAGSIAASAALANAGIEMLGLVTSCVAATIGPEIWLDPIEEESSKASGSLTFACMPALGTVTHVWQTGHIPPDKAILCMEQCQEQCTEIIHQIVASALLGHGEGT